MSSVNRLLSMMRWRRDCAWITEWVMVMMVVVAVLSLVWT